MSYDLLFLHGQPAPGQTWQQVMELAEEAAEKAEGPLPGPLADAWERVVPEARRILGDVEENAAEDFRELAHGASGVQLSFAEGEVTISVPYWHRGDDAARVMDDVYALAEIVERETGLTGYDPQLDRSLALAARADAAAVLDETTRMLPDIWRDGER